MNEKQFFKNGNEYIVGEIAKAIADGSRTAVITGFWEIESEIRLPSNFTLILENCHLKMADGVYSNMFVNENYCTESGRTLSGTDKNINIKGRGMAILDGGSFNGLTERTAMKNGLPSIWKNATLIFSNVDGFSVSDIKVINQRWWALTFVFSRNGYIGNVEFCSNDTAIDETGKEYHGLKYDKYEEVLLKNSDGIDLRIGCHDILIENITGFIEDDTVALTAIPGGYEEKALGVSGLPSDIYNVEVRNIRTASYCSNVRLLNQGGAKLHDILVDGVYDQSESSPHLDHGATAVKIGDMHMYGSRHATEDETYNI
ncbi:MAG: hypothetical protein J6Q68_02835, partial [Clostridia bacterium]|nr:hypothetical protein [Clostridia bacterium]